MSYQAINRIVNKDYREVANIMLKETLKNDFSNKGKNTKKQLIDHWAIEIKNADKKMQADYAGRDITVTRKKIAQEVYLGIIPLMRRSHFGHPSLSEELGEDKL